MSTRRHGTLRRSRTRNRVRALESRALEESLRRSRERAAADRALLEVYDRLHREAGLMVCRPAPVAANPPTEERDDNDYRSRPPSRRRSRSRSFCNAAWRSMRRAMAALRRRYSSQKGD